MSENQNNNETVLHMACRGCESLEEHKLVDNKWVCQWCDHKEEE